MPYLTTNTVFVLATLPPMLWLILSTKLLTPLTAKNIWLKAFVTLHHAILLWQLEASGITGTAHQWIIDYFCNKKQFVQIDASKSDALRQICGIPQGSILGPLFFIIYINDLPACPNELELILEYASIDNEYEF